MERLAATLFSQCGLGQGAMTEYVSKSFIFKASQNDLDDVIDKYADSQNTSEDVSEIESILLMTEGETLRIQWLFYGYLMCTT